MARNIMPFFRNTMSAFFSLNTMTIDNEMVGFLDPVTPSLQPRSHSIHFISLDDSRKLSQVVDLPQTFKFGYGVKVAS
ncbi:hypothetical protein NPIL_86231 [Nephila pilipes]|uniref:Uncharacterized protein n=1 Tax=Nephila pilipes TaxID=299642 RepID=A0A8X6Q4Y5_NEPPI|nr:hypothetical protein NPIL_86231 [Nephila pilipes]